MSTSNDNEYFTNDTRNMTNEQTTPSTGDNDTTITNASLTSVTMDDTTTTSTTTTSLVESDTSTNINNNVTINTASSTATTTNPISSTATRQPSNDPQSHSQSTVNNNNNNDNNTSTTDAMKSTSTTATIQMIPKESIQRIVAGQAIYDLTSCIKELIDNAIDANSTTINIRLHNKGIDIIEVSDDGTGVSKGSRPYIALPHATSKIIQYEDIYSNHSMSNANQTLQSSTFGFRGEALYCIANISEQLIVATRTKIDKVAERMEFNKDGTLNETTITTISRKVGTSVAVMKLFDRLPVRRKDYIQHITEQRQKMIQMIIGYAIYHPNIRFHCMDISAKSGREKSLFITPYYPINQLISLKESVSSILGTNILNSLSNVTVDLSQYINDYSTNINNITNITSATTESTNDSTTMSWKMSGYISTNTQQQQQQQQILPINTKASATNTTTKAGVHYFAINQRPVDVPKLSRLFNKLYRTYNVDSNSTSNSNSKASCCTCVIEFHLPLCIYDINLSPDKRQVQFYNEQLLYTIVEQALTEFWRKDSNSYDNSDKISTVPSLRSLQQQRLSSLGTSTHTNHDRKASLITASSSNHPTEQGHNDDNSSSYSMDSMSFSTVFELPTENPLVQQQLQSNNTRRISHIKGDALLNSSMHSVDSMNRSFHRRYAFVHDPQQSISKQLEYQNTSPKKMDTNATNCDITDNNGDEIKIGVDIAPPASRQISIETTSRNLTDSTMHDYYTPKEAKIVITPSPGTVALDEAITSTMSTKYVVDDCDRNGSASSQWKATDKDYLQFQHMKETFRRSSYDNDNLAQCVATKLQDHDGSVVKTISSSLLSRFGHRERSKSDSDVNQDTIYRAHKSVKRQRLHDVTRNEVEKMSNDENADAPLSTTTLWQSVIQTSDDIVMASMQDRIAGIRRKRNRIQHRNDNGPDESVMDTIDLTVPDVGATGASLSQSTHTATTNHPTTLRKDDLRSMKVIGQFNLGFILASTPDNNLWILDQHACDERYQFETLLRSTNKFYEQPLIAPLPLELSYIEETCILDHLTVFEQNGFRLHYDETKPSRHRFSLLAVPHSGAPDGRNAVQYGKQDVIDLCSILLDRNHHNYDDNDTYMYSSNIHGGTGTDGSGKYGNNAVRRYAGSDGPSSSILTMTQHGTDDASSDLNTAEKIIFRLPKTIAMMASRACRSSIMIGKALSIKEMEKLIHRLSSEDIVSPFICAHGRPTICHIQQEMSTMIQYDERAASDHITGPTITCGLSQEEAIDENDDNNLKE